MTTIDEGLVRKVLTTVDAGLVRGLGDRVPGKMCVEAAVCYALGYGTHSDRPQCVGDAVRKFKIDLNDNDAWSSPQARAKGMRRVAIAQLGSDTIDQNQFATELVIAMTNKMLPVLVDAAGEDILTSVIDQCETATTAEQAGEAAAHVAVCVPFNYALIVAARHLFSATILTNNASYFSVDQCGAAANLIAQEAVRVKGLLHWRKDRWKDMDTALTVIAELGIGVLQKLQSPGCLWLDLCDKPV